MRKILTYIGIIVASVFVGVITAIIFTAFGAKDFTVGQWTGVLSTMTSFILLRITE